MSWSEYFPQAEPPQEILRLVDEEWAEDISEPKPRSPSVDAPSFGLRFPDGAEVWIVSFEDNPQHRIYGLPHSRFSVWIYDPGYDVDHIYAETDDVEEAIEAYKDAVTRADKKMYEEYIGPKDWVVPLRQPPMDTW